MLCSGPCAPGNLGREEERGTGSATRTVESPTGTGHTSRGPDGRGRHDRDRRGRSQDGPRHGRWLPWFQGLSLHPIPTPFGFPSSACSMRHPPPRSSPLHLVDYRSTFNTRMRLPGLTMVDSLPKLFDTCLMACQLIRVVRTGKLADWQQNDWPSLASVRGS